MRYEICTPEIVAESLDGEVVAINLASGSYYSVHGLGADVWAAIEAGASLDEIERWLDSFGAVDTPDIDLAQFVQQLSDEGLVRRTDRPAGALPAPPGPGAHKPPVLEKFTDMQDLLLIDPVHDVGAEGWPNASSR